MLRTGVVLGGSNMGNVYPVVDDMFLPFMYCLLVTAAGFSWLSKRETSDDDNNCAPFCFLPFLFAGMAFFPSPTQEQHTSVLPSSDGRLYRRHDLLSQVQAPGVHPRHLR